MPELIVDASDTDLAALLLRLGSQPLLRALGDAVDGFEDEAEDTALERFSLEDDRWVGEGVEWWTLILLHHGPNAVGALIMATISLFSEPKDDTEDLHPDYTDVFVRLTLTEHDGVWNVDAGAVLKNDDLSPPLASEGENPLAEPCCPLCGSEDTGRLFIGFPGPEAEKQAVAARMIFAGDILYEHLLGTTRGCRACGYMWAEAGDEESDGFEPD
jgi:hypothetical protein